MGKQIAGARDKYLDPGEDDVLLWDASSGQEIGKLSAPQGETFDIAFSHDGQRLATGGDDNLVHVWNIATLAGEERLHATAPLPGLPSKDGARLVAPAQTVWHDYGMCERARHRRSTMWKTF